MKNALSPAVLFVVFVLSVVPAARGQGSCGSAVAIERGDTLSGIAGRCGTTVSALLRANPRITDPDLIYAGRTLQMPGGARTEPQPPPAAPPPAARRDEPSPKRQLVLRGHLTDEGVECPAMRTADGTLYTLAGDTGAFEAGDSVRVTGTVAEISFCMQGTTVAVSSIEALR